MSTLRRLFHLWLPRPLARSPRSTFAHTTQGAHYNLQEIYNEINHRYFEGKLELQISWSGDPKRPARRARRLGVYSYRNKQIRIHRLLDHPRFPSYFIAFVVYHEMLHSVLPPFRKGGKFRIHHAEFKQQERAFEQFEEAKRWEKENKQLFF